MSDNGEALNLQIPYNYTPRGYQEDFYNAIANGYNRMFCRWHRRAGKDKTAINIIAKQALKRIGNYFHIFPTYSQGRKAIWDYIDPHGFRMTDHIPPAIRKGEPNQTEMKINFYNGSMYQIIGSDNIDSIMGSNPLGLVYSEWGLQRQSAWDLMQPILMENKGWAAFISTPRGKNHMYVMENTVKQHPEWFYSVLTIDDTKIITDEQIRQAISSGMSQDLIDQEFYCSYEASITGAYYANEMRAMRADGRICSVPPDPAVPVFTFWDLGFSDYTSIWFVQFIGKEIRLCHYYQNCGESLVHYANYIADWRASKGVLMGKAVLPHDAGSKSLQTGKNSLEVLSELGMECTITGRVKQKQDGIEAVRKVLPRCWIDDKGCFDGIEALTQYRKEFNDKYGVFQVHPVHDKHSHGADAMQTLALWLQHEDPTQKAERYLDEHRDYAHIEHGWMGV